MFLTTVTLANICEILFKYYGYTLTLYKFICVYWPSQLVYSFMFSKAMALANICRIKVVVFYSEVYL